MGQHEKERRRYRTLMLRTWGDEKFRALPAPAPNPRYLFLYCILGPHTTQLPGLFSATDVDMAKRLEWPLVAFHRVCKRLIDDRMVLADWSAPVIWLPKAVYHNEPDNQNVVKGWRTAMDEIPECAIKRLAAWGYLQYLQGRGQKFVDAFGTDWPEPLPKQFDLLLPKPLPERFGKQEQEQERNRKGEDEGAASDDADAASDGKQIHTFVKGFCDLYAETLHGSKYTVNHSKDIPLVRRLLKTHGVDRLLKLAHVLFLAEDDWLDQTDRGIGILSSRINWLETRLRAAEAQQKVVA